MEGDPIDEKSDVWPMGANIFAILSGLFPYYNINGTKLIEKVIANGTKPYLDPRYKERSFIEGGLYDIMEPCFEVDPAERIDIFTVVRHLREMKEAVIKERSNGDSVPYRGDEIMSKLATRIVNAEKKKQQDRELHLQLHGNLDEFDTTATYGEYEGDDDETDEDLGAGDDEI
jgi:serine/threonine protein kinase